MHFCFCYDIITHVEFVYHNVYHKRRCIQMAKCSVCGKGVTFGQNVSHSNRKTNRMWKPNIRRVKAVVDGTHKTVYVCSSCLRSGKVTRV